MKPTHKAKRVNNGEWVEGWFDGSDPNLAPIMWTRDTTDECGYTFCKVDPSTLCERVRGTEFFEGDFVSTRVNNYCFTGYLFYVESKARWAVKDIDGVGYWLSECRDLKSTGKNKHDNE